MKSMKFKAVIFDMDGVLINSEKYWALVEKNFFEARGVPFTKEVAVKIMGGSDQDLIRWGKEKFGWKDSSKAIQEERNQLSEAIYTELCEPLPGAIKLLKMLRQKSVKIALASSTALRRIKIILERFGWQSYFDVIVSAEQISAPAKPHPAIYQTTAQFLKEEPTTCVVLEDSVNGVRSAKAASMVCVAVPEVAYEGEGFDGADLVIKKLTDPELYSFLQI